MIHSHILTSVWSEDLKMLIFQATSPTLATGPGPESSSSSPTWSQGHSSVMLVCIYLDVYTSILILLMVNVSRQIDISLDIYNLSSLIVAIILIDSVYCRQINSAQ